MLDLANNAQCQSVDAIELPNRSHRLVSEFLDAPHIPTKEGSYNLAPDGDVECYIMATYVLWVTITSGTTMNLGPVMPNLQNHNRLLYQLLFVW